MQKIRHSRLLQVSSLLLASIFWLSNGNNPPTGRTGAPFDGTCASCHGGNSNNFDGEVAITLNGQSNLTIQPGMLYAVRLTMTVTGGNPTEGGYQLVVVDGNNADAGDITLIMGNTQSGTETLASMREYAEHRGGKAISGGTVSWDFNWTSPGTAAGNTIKFYFIANFSNNNNGSSGDYIVPNAAFFDFNGPPPLEAGISATTNVSCNGGNNGTATVSASGGNAPYAYLWSNGQTGQTATNLIAGNYTVTVTGAGGSGTATASTNISQPAALSVSAAVSGSINCANSEVTVTANVTGGVGPYDYAWSNGSTGSSSFYGAPGAYSLTVTDVNGCTKSATFNIGSNTNSPVAAASANGIISCSNSSVALSGAGSSTGASFTYLWTTVDGNIATGQNTLNPTVNECGTYILTVTNTANNCTAQASVEVSCNVDTPNVNAIGGSITCANPTVVLNGNSSTSGATYAWSGPGITPNNQFFQNPVVGQAGNYILTVTDPITGCTATTTAIVTPNTTPPTVSTISGTLTCNSPSITLGSITNATSPAFSWAGPGGFLSALQTPSVSVAGTYTVTVTNLANGCANTATATVNQNTVPPGATASNDGPLTCTDLSAQLLGNSPTAGVTFVWTGMNFSSAQQNPSTSNANSYLLTVTNPTNGCTSTAATTVGLNIAPPMASIVAPSNLNCNAPAVQINATASSQGPNFTYLWSTTSGNIVNGSATLTPTVNAAGIYNLLITNTENGCTATAATAVNQTPPVVASIAATSNASCNGVPNGVATAAGSGGNGAFAYLWSNAATNATITGLLAGTYGVTVTDGENCSATATAAIGQPSALSLTIMTTAETALGANNGTATAEATGGTMPYTYVWNNASTTQTLNSLAPGVYAATVADANGCTAVQTATVNAFGCSLSALAFPSDASCNGSNTGSIALGFNGATLPIGFLWSNNATTETLSNLAAGTYTATVTDGSNCSVVISATVAEPPPLSANASATSVTSLSASDGTATAQPTGGTPGYAYAWSNGESTQSIVGLAPNNYTLIISDANGCSSSQTVTVNGFDCDLAGTVSVVNVSCNGLADGQATAVLTAGTLPYNYNWASGASTATITNLPMGNYSATVTDGAGCTVALNAPVTQPEVLNTDVNVTNVICPESPLGAASAMTTGGTVPYAYQWPNDNPNNLTAGNYLVVTIDANGCTDATPFIILAIDDQAPTLDCPDNIVVCGADLVDYADPTVSDNCQLATPQLSLISGLPTGSAFDDGVSVQVFRATDSNGNSATCSFSVTVLPLPDILLDAVTNDVNGAGLGSIFVTPTGGAGSYSFAWSKNGQPFSAAEDLVGLTAGVYTLIATDANGCTVALAPVTIGNSVGSAEPTALSSIQILPNPAHSAIRLKIIDLDIIAAQIIDMRGRLVQVLTPAECASEISVEQLPVGIYWLKIYSMDGGVRALKFARANN